MSNTVAISGLPFASSVNDADTIPIVQGGVTMQATAAQVQRGTTFGKSLTEAADAVSGLSLLGIPEAPTSIENEVLGRVLINRAGRLHSLLTASAMGAVDPFHLQAVGNSIIYGSGASSAALAWTYVLAGKIRAMTLNGTTNDWAPSNNAVGGSTIACAICYLATVSDATTNMPQASPATANIGGVLMEPIRNSANNITLSDYEALLRSAIRAVIRTGKDCVIVSDPPAMSGSTVLDDDTNWTPWLSLTAQIAAEEGAAFVDVWTYLMHLRASGQDISLYLQDGVHPNDSGHALIADLVFKTITTKPTIESPISASRATNVGWSHAISVYSPSFSDVSLADFSLDGAATARMAQTGELTAKGYLLADGQSVLFRSPIPAYGVIPHIVTVPGSTGTANISYNGISAGTLSGGGSFRREFMIASLFVNYGGSGANQRGIVADVAITASGGQVLVTGATFIGPEAISPIGIVLDGAESGTWSDSTLPNGNPARRTVTEGDYVDIHWHGTELVAKFRQGVSEGIASWTTDGGSSDSFDCYGNFGDRTSNPLPIARKLADTWHTSRITFSGHNASSLPTVGLSVGDVQWFSTAPRSDTRIVPLIAGTAVPLCMNWRRAVIHRAISGSPLLDRFKPEAAMVTVEGSGTALVRLEA